MQGRFSPDGHWIAYASNESGAYEVYVQSYPPEQGKSTISRARGADPRWRRDGKELFFVSPERKLMAVDVTTAPQFDATIPHELFEIPVSGMTDVRTHYAVTHDGQRFLDNKVLDRGNAPLTVVVDWQAQLKS